MDDVYDLVVVGGGAAGYFGAIAASQDASSPIRILILEKARRTLGKVLISGGGRCNVTYACYAPAELVKFYPRGGQALRGAFSRFQPADTIEWFERRGIRLKTEVDGRIFPVTDDSRTIVSCLEDAAQERAIEIWTQITVKSVHRLVDGFTLQLASSRSSHIPAALTCRKLLLATGGDSTSLQLVEQLGHRIEPPVPSLFTFKISDPRLEGLAGVSVPLASLKLGGDQEEKSKPAGLSQAGPVLITHWGLSGPAVLRLSAWGARWLHERAYQADLEINWLFPLDQDALSQKIRDWRSGRSRQFVHTNSPLHDLPNRLWARLVYAAGIPDTQQWANLTRDQSTRLEGELTAGHYRIQGKGTFKEEFVTCGGVNLDEVNFKTMESKLVPGLYLAGEILDVDGLTGGFNFQNAWTTGWLAGRAAAG